MKPLIIGNWKANKTISEAKTWVEGVKPKAEVFENLDIVVCGSFVTLPILNNLLSDSKIKVGAQNVSKFPKGAYTGEVSAEMLEGLVSYCLVGHSERKKYFGEDDADIVSKVEALLEKSITPVLCTADVKQLDSYLGKSQILKEEAEKVVFVYEPPHAISGGGSYHPESPKEANEVCQKFSEKLGLKSVVIYGGSVNPENINSFLDQPSIHGALPGQASLEAETFTKLLSAANASVV